MKGRTMKSEKVSMMDCSKVIGQDRGFAVGVRCCVGNSQDRFAVQ
jgi:hypothetical protein